jgi:hypothetical protein
MKINCQCGKRLTISQTEINRDAIIRCTGCGTPYNVRLVKVENFKDLVKTANQILIVNR